MVNYSNQVEKSRLTQNVSSVKKFIVSQDVKVKWR